MARVAVDATAVTAGGKGISRVQQALLAALARADLPHELHALVREPADAELLSVDVPCLSVGGGLTLQRELLAIPRAVRRHELDVVVTTADRFPPWRGSRYVVWLYETPTHRIRHVWSEGAGAYQRGSDLATLLLWKTALRRARAVVASSSFTARDVAAAVRGLRHEPRVIYPGRDERFTPGDPARATSDPYVFLLASADPRENVETAVAAFGLASRRLPEPVRLVLAGDLGGRRARVERAIADADVSDRVELRGRVADSELIRLYRGAAAYLDATLFEGFGFQALEAIACGTPVIASNVTSIPEVVGAGGILCDPRSPEQFADALVAVLSDPVLARRLRHEALAQAARFDWTTTAAQFAEVVRDALAPEPSSSAVGPGDRVG